VGAAVKPEVRAKLEKQQYRIVGPRQHSAVKLCHWTKEDLKKGRHCYKGDFYGIESHGCMQMTPTVDHCNFRCVYCWRHHGFTSLPMDQGLDHPADIVMEAIEAQRQLLTGYKGHPTVEYAKWWAAQAPKHVAISLTGEPTMYPHLGDLIAECHKYGMTTFLVTNGSHPEVLADLDPLPTQLYVSVDAPNEEIFKRICVPTVPNAWEKIQETLALLPSLDTRKVARHTLVKGYGPEYVTDYAKQDKIAEPDFIEAKGYVFVGDSRQRLTIGHMPSNEEVLAFSQELAAATGYHFRQHNEASRVCLLTKTMDDPRLRPEHFPVMRVNPWEAKGRLDQGLPALGETISPEVAVPAPFIGEGVNVVLDLDSLARLGRTTS
jgi:tRNA wybutosine-synthesizing protein 1